MPANVQQLLFGVGNGLVHLAPGDLAVREIAIAERYTAHVQAFEHFGFEALTDDELGAAAADVDHQSSAAIVGQGMGNAQVDEAGFFTAGDDFHRVAQHFLGQVHEDVGVAGHPEGIGADDLNATRWHAVQSLSEPTQAGQASLLRLGVRLLASSRPAPSWTFSPIFSRVRISPCTSRATTMWKLLEPMSMAARTSEGGTEFSEVDAAVTVVEIL